MHDLRKRFEQRVRDVVQKRRIGIETRESLRLEFEALASKVFVDKAEHGTLGGIGRIDRRKRSQDGLLIRVGGLVDKRFRVRPEIGKVDGLQDLVDHMRVKKALEACEKPTGTYRSGAEYFARTPGLHWWKWYLRGQRGGKGGHWTSHRCHRRDRWDVGDRTGRRCGAWRLGLRKGACSADGVDDDEPFGEHSGVLWSTFLRGCLRQ